MVVVYEITWILLVLKDLNVIHDLQKKKKKNVIHDRLALFFNDSQVVLHIGGENPVFHERMKHIKIDCHVVRDKTQAEVIKLLQINTHS